VGNRAGLSGSTITADDTLKTELDRVFGSDLAAVADAQRLWKRLREEAPVRWHDGTLLLSRYSDVRPLLGSEVVDFPKDTEKMHMGPRPELSDAESRLHQEVVEFQRLFLGRNPDPAHHDRVRGIVHRAFTPRRIAVSSDAADRPTPTTCSTTPARRKPSASEPPIRPTPTITNRELENEEATTPSCQKKAKRHCSPMYAAPDA